MYQCSYASRRGVSYSSGTEERCNGKDVLHGQLVTLLTLQQTFFRLEQGFDFKLSFSRSGGRTESDGEDSEGGGEDGGELHCEMA